MWRWKPDHECSVKESSGWYLDGNGGDAQRPGYWGSNVLAVRGTEVCDSGELRMGVREHGDDLSSESAVHVYTVKFQTSSFIEIIVCLLTALTNP